MKSASPALLAMFATNQDFEQFDLYTITLTSGFVLRYTDCLFDVVTGGNTFYCSRAQGIILNEAGDSGPRARWTSDLNVGNWQVTIIPRPGDLIGAQPWLPAVRAGILDEATVRVDRGYIAAWPSFPTLTLVPVGTINVFFGRIAGIDFGRSVVQISMNDPRELLATDQPRNLYSAGCRYALFGPGCTLLKANFAAGGTVIDDDTSQTFMVTVASKPDGYYDLGEIAFLTGENAGLRMMVRRWLTSGLISLLAPLPFDVEIGDTFNLYPGCDKTESTCVTKFNNRQNFGGFKYIPAPEAAI